MSDLTHYVFKSVWKVQAPLLDLMDVLYDIETYPDWWPEFREIRPLGGGRFEVVARSFLPYELRFVSEGEISDPASGIIDAKLSGDMEGTVRWTVEEVGDGCRLTYDQEVSTNKRLLNVLAPVARPGFRANHSIMMRHGQAGLRTYMAGYRRGSSPPADSAT